MTDRQYLYGTVLAFTGIIVELITIWLAVQ